MGIADELQKLSELLKNGTLTNEEFAQAKIRLLAEPATKPTVEVSEFLEDQLTEVRYQNELARIDREWEIERRQYQVVGRFGRSFTPTIGTGIATAVVGGIFGLFWTVTAYTIISMSRSLPMFDESYSVIGTIFPLIGILFTVTAIWRGIYFCVLSQNYNVAYEAYKQRHLKASTADHGATNSSGD